MLLVKTKTGPSPISGTGLFADAFIVKGTKIWEFNKKVDEAFSKDEIEQLPEPKRSEILSLYFSYISKQTGRYILCGDDAKFINHDANPTITSVYLDGREDVGFAARDINPGEELTVDYATFDEPITFDL